MDQKQVDAKRDEQAQALVLALFETTVAARNSGTSDGEILGALAIFSGAVLNEFTHVKTARALYDQLLDFSMAKAAKHFPRERPTVN